MSRRVRSVVDRRTGRPVPVPRHLRADTLLFSLHVDDALALAESVIADEWASTPARLQAVASASMGWALRADWAKVHGIGGTWRTLARQHRDVPYVEERLRIAQWLALAFEGRLLEAEAAAAEQVELARAHGAEVITGVLIATYGRVLLDRGRAHHALAVLTEAVEVLRESDMFAIRPIAMAWRARAAVFCRGRRTPLVKPSPKRSG